LGSSGQMVEGGRGREGVVGVGEGRRWVTAGAVGARARGGKLKTQSSKHKGWGNGRRGGCAVKALLRVRREKSG
jgi:hypothetical protein